LKTNIYIWLKKTRKARGLETQILNSTSKRNNHKRSQDHTTRPEIPHQSGDQISTQKAKTPKTIILRAAFKRSRTFQGFEAAYPDTNRRHVKQIHGKHISTLI